MPEIKNDPINHPSHYTSGKIEVIDFLEDQKFPFHLANAVKYLPGGKEGSQQNRGRSQESDLVSESVYQCA